MSLNFSNAALYAYLVKEVLHMTNAQCWRR